MIKIYEYPICSTCKKAKKFITDNNLNAEFINIKENTPTKTELKEFLKYFELKKLFNTSGKSYRENNIKEKLKTILEDEALDLVINDGMLIKRPLLINTEKNIYLIGFKENEWEKLI